MGGFRMPPSPRKNSERRSRQQQCVYCGKIGECTRDHVIPKALFSAALPVNMLTMPACLECNQRKGDLDIYLRDFLTADISSYENPTAKAVLNGPVRRSVRKNRSKLWRGALAAKRWVPVHSPAGIYLGDLPAMPAVGRQINLALTMLTKGLFAQCFRQRLPGDAAFDIGRLDPLLVAQLWERLFQPGTYGPFGIGKDVFDFAFFVASNGPLITHWLLRFYTSIFFIVTTKSTVVVPSPPVTH
jgi:hypothetical protein